MEELSRPISQCSHCSTAISIDDKFCISCGFPEGGTEQEQSKFHADRIIEHSKTKESAKVLRNARNTLFVIAALSFLGGLFLFFAMDDFAGLIAQIILSVIYVVLGYWSQQKPLIALVLGLLVYATTVVLMALIEPSTIYRGIIIKIFVIVYLGRGINSALHLRKTNAS